MKVKDYFRVFPIEGWDFTRLWMKFFKLASQAVRKSSLTRENILARVGEGLARATSRAKAFTFDAQMRLYFIRVFLVGKLQDSIMWELYVIL